MSDTACAFTKPDGDPCAAHALPASRFCVFHDPDHADARAAGRSKGGSTARRRSRRFPRILDHMHIAEIMGELLIDALNEPVPLDNKRLNALTHLCQVLLKAVGTPEDSFLAHCPHAEPPVTEEHLLRLYATLSPDLEPVLATAAPTDSDPDPLNTDPGPLNARTPERLNAQTPEHLTPLTTSGEHTLTVMNAPAYKEAACFLNNETLPVVSPPEQEAAAPTAEQAANKPSTSAPATNTPRSRAPLPAIR